MSLSDYWLSDCLHLWQRLWIPSLCLSAHLTPVHNHRLFTGLWVYLALVASGFWGLILGLSDYPLPVWKVKSCLYKHLRLVPPHSLTVRSSGPSSRSSPFPRPTPGAAGEWDRCPHPRHRESHQPPVPAPDPATSSSPTGSWELRPHGQLQPQSSDPPDPEPMQLSHANFPRLNSSDQHLCIYCGGAGHLVTSCQSKAATCQWVKGSWRAQPFSHPL